ncbi:hypothetical protein [Acetobacter papayae]|uniref:hypothetical protein n=1 Tax=Acetobacter papayae TaxID=1076592 RepID=UPI001F3DD646|nr:hypothetical protein [Acetobacter papayae]
MSEPLPGTAFPWLSVIGMGEDRLEALPPASRAALDEAEVVFGAPVIWLWPGLRRLPVRGCGRCPLA